MRVRGASTTTWPRTRRRWPTRPGDRARCCVVTALARRYGGRRRWRCSGSLSSDPKPHRCPTCRRRTRPRSRSGHRAARFGELLAAGGAAPLARCRADMASGPRDGRRASATSCGTARAGDRGGRSRPGSADRLSARTTTLRGSTTRYGKRRALLHHVAVPRGDRVALPAGATAGDRRTPPDGPSRSRSAQQPDRPALVWRTGHSWSCLASPARSRGQRGDRCRQPQSPALPAPTW